MRANTVREKLGAGEVALGCFVRYPSGTLVELLSLVGWDFLVFDGEHGSIDLLDQTDLCRACELHGVIPMTRVRSGSDLAIGPSLDAGIMGVHLPGLSRGEDVLDAVARLRYPPRGTRGLAGTRISRFGLGEDLGEYTMRANDEVLGVVQVENWSAVEEIEEWVAIQELDVLFLGPTDLATSMGYPGEPSNPAVMGAMERVAEVVNASEKSLGVFVATPESALHWIGMGARYIATGLEGLLSRISREFVSDVRDSMGRSQDHQSGPTG